MVSIILTLPGGSQAVLATRSNAKGIAAKNKFSIIVPPSRSISMHSSSSKMYEKIE